MPQARAVLHVVIGLSLSCARPLAGTERPFRTPSIRPAAVLAAPAPGAPAPTPTPTTPIEAKTRGEVVETLAAHLDARYVLPEVAAALARELRARLAAGAYARLGDSAALAEALTTELRALSHDKHLRVMFRPEAPSGLPPPHLSPMLERSSSGIRKLEILDGDIGYLALDAVPQLEQARAGIEAAFALLQPTEALIIDNRNNHGGDPRTVALYMSYLREGPPVVVNTFHAREGGHVEEFRTVDLGEKSYGVDRPVFVLTSAGTFSGGEELSYDLQAFKRAVLVGERTGGRREPRAPGAARTWVRVIFWITSPGAEGTADVCLDDVALTRVPKGARDRSAPPATLAPPESPCKGVRPCPGEIR